MSATPKTEKWRDAISITEQILTITEIWPKKDGENVGLIRKMKIFFIIVACTVFDVAIIDELYNLFIKQDYETLSMHLSTFGLYIGYTIKILIFQFKKGTPMKKMLRSIEQPIFEDYPEEMEVYKSQCIKVSNGVALFYALCVALGIIMYLCKPFYTKYPLPVTFSHDISIYLVYGLWALDAFCNYYLVMIGICFDMIIIGLINIATTQLDILQHEITHFEPAETDQMDEDEHRFFRKCTERHIAIIKFIEEVEEVFTLIFLVQCLSSVTSICNGVFQLAHTGELFSVQFYTNCIFVFDVLFELAVCCWFATLLTLKSLEVADACYNYNWLNSSTRIKKLLLLMLHRSQQPLFITAGKVTRLSMGSYLQVLKTAYSYFALMQSLYDKKNK